MHRMAQGVARRVFIKERSSTCHHVSDCSLSLRFDLFLSLVCLYNFSHFFISSMLVIILMWSEPPSISDGNDTEYSGQEVPLPDSGIHMSLEQHSLTHFPSQPWELDVGQRDRASGSALAPNLHLEFCHRDVTGGTCRKLSRFHS